MTVDLAPLTIEERQPNAIDAIQNQIQLLTQQKRELERQIWNAQAKCSHRYRPTSAITKQKELIHNNAIVLSLGGGGDASRIELRCLDCNHSWSARPSEVCFNCGTQFEDEQERTLTKEKVEELIDQHGLHILVRGWKAAGEGWEEYICPSCRLQMVYFHYTYDQ